METRCNISVFETIELMWWYLIFQCNSCVNPHGAAQVLGFSQPSGPFFLYTYEIRMNDLLSFNYVHKQHIYWEMHSFNG